MCGVCVGGGSHLGYTKSFIKLIVLFDRVLSKSKCDENNGAKAKNRKKTKGGQRSPYRKVDIEKYIMI